MSEQETSGGRAVLKPGKDITASVVNELKASLKGLIDRGEKNLLIDLNGVEMVDSMGLGLFIATYNTLEPLHGTLEVINANPDILDLFRSMRLDKYIRIGNCS